MDCIPSRKDCFNKTGMKSNVFPGSWMTSGLKSIFEFEKNASSSLRASPRVRAIHAREAHRRRARDANKTRPAGRHEWKLPNERKHECEPTIEWKTASGQRSGHTLQFAFKPRLLLAKPVAGDRHVPVPSDQRPERGRILCVATSQQSTELVVLAFLSSLPSFWQSECVLVELQ